MAAIFEVKMKDDITAASAAAAKSIEELRLDVQSLSNTFKASQSGLGALNVGLKDARSLFAASGQNVKMFKAALKDAGASTLDATILTAKLKGELAAERKEVLGITGELRDKAKADKDAAAAAKAHSKEMKEAEARAAKISAAGSGRTVGIKQARGILGAQGGNIELTKEALKGMGVSARDSAILVSKLNSEIDYSRRSAMGMEGFWKKVFDPKVIWHFSHALNVVSKGLGAIEAVAGPIFGGLSKVGGMLFEGGSSMVTNVIEAAQFRQNSLVAIASEMEGDEKERMKQAKDLFKFAQQTAKETPLDTKDVIAGIRDLKIAKFSTAESKLLYRLVADQASKHMDDPGFGKQVISAFARVQGRGTATGEDLESMRVAGFNAKEISMELLAARPDLFGKAKGKFKESEEHGLKYIKEVLGKGDVSSTTLLNAVIAASEKNKPDIGQLAKQLGSSSLTGAISNAKSAFSDLVMSVDVADWPGIKSLIKFLGRISAGLDADSDSGRAFLQTIRTATNSIFEGLDHITQSDINSMIGKLGQGVLYIADTLEKAWKWFGEILNGQKSLGEGAEEMLIDVGMLIGQGVKASFTTVFGESRKDKRIRESAGISDSAIGSIISAGGGIEYAKQVEDYKAAGNKIPQAAWFENQDALTYSVVREWAEKTAEASKEQTANLAAATSGNLFQLSAQSAQSLVDGWRSTMQQHSPSKVLLELGRTAAESLTGGLSGGFDKAERSDRSGGGGDIQVVLNVSGAIGDPSAVGEALVQPVVSALARIYRRAAREG